MRRLLVLAPQVAVAVVAGIAVGLLWLARDDDRGSGPPPAEAVTATGTVAPDRHVFGSPVVARVDVVVDNRTVDPRSVRVETDFTPYDAVGKPTVQHVDSGALSLVRFEYALRCLGEGCEPTGATGTVEFELGRVLYRFQGQSGDAVELLDWPPIEVIGRVADPAVNDIRWRASEAELVPPTYRTGPVGASAALFAAALVLASGAAWLAWRLWRPRPLRAERDEHALVIRSALERALDSARVASRNGDPGMRRRALERVSRELDAVGLHGLAVDASVRAWRPAGPEESDVEELAHRSAIELNGGEEA